MTKATIHPAYHLDVGHLRVLEIEEIKTVPCAPPSHPHFERSIDTLRHEDLDRVFLCNAADLGLKLSEFTDYCNVARVHRALAGVTPTEQPGTPSLAPATLAHDACREPCRGLFQIPIAA